MPDFDPLIGEIFRAGAGLADAGPGQYLAVGARDTTSGSNENCPRLLRKSGGSRESGPLSSLRRHQIVARGVFDVERTQHRALGNFQSLVVEIVVGFGRHRPFAESRLSRRTSCCPQRRRGEPGTTVFDWRLCCGSSRRRMRAGLKDDDPIAGPHRWFP